MRGRSVEAPALTGFDYRRTIGYDGIGDDRGGSGESMNMFARGRPSGPAGAGDEKASGPAGHPFGLWRRHAAELEDRPAPDGLPRFSIDAAADATDSLRDDRPAAAQARLALADALAAAQPVLHRDRFAGRVETLTRLIAAIEQQRAHVVLYGERGIGKTSLLHVFAETARAASYHVLYASCGVEARFDAMFRTFCEQVPLLYHASVSPTGDETEHRRSFADLLGAHPVDPRELAELFGEVVGTRIILILDEYDRVADHGFRRDVAELIKNLSDRAARTQLILTGVASNLEELVGFAPSIRRNITGLPVGPMAEAEMLEILERAEAASGVRFGPEARALITRMAGGSPYLVRLLGGRAAMLALDHGRLTVEAADLMAGTEAVLSEWNVALPRRVQLLLQRPQVQAQWQMLIAAARASGTPDGWFAPEDLAAELPGTGAEAALAALEGLAGAGDLFEQGSDAGRGTRFRFRNPGVAQLLGLSAALARAGG